MKVVPFDEDAFLMDHPRGMVAFNYPLMGGEPESPENFRYILGRQEGDFSQSRHRHGFKQIRLPMIGDMHLGEQGILHEGEIGYIPEGVTYGPQDDPLGAPKQLRWVLQFDGASGLGMPLARGAGPGHKESQRRPRERGLQGLPRGWFGGVAFGGYETAQRIATAIGIAVATALYFCAEATEGCPRFGRCGPDGAGAVPRAGRRCRVDRPTVAAPRRTGSGTPAEG